MLVISRVFQIEHLKINRFTNSGTVMVSCSYYLTSQQPLFASGSVLNLLQLLSRYCTTSSLCTLHRFFQNTMDVPDIQYYPVSSQVSGIRLDSVSGIKQYLVLSGTLYPVESHIRYYPEHCQLLPNTAATDFYGI